MNKWGKADLKPVRQRTQYTCVATSVTMALNSLGKDLTEDQVNRILGAEPKKGARWEEAIATIQYFGCRATLTAPSTLAQIKEWTDSWRPVLIAWNPEGRPWSHASCVFHVEQGPPEIWAEDVGDDAQIQGSGPGLYVWVADPNIPDPSKTYRIVHEREFYEKWGEDWGDFIVRRPALMVDLEITQDGRQVMASDKSAGRKGKRPQRTTAPKDPKDKLRFKVKPKPQRNEDAKWLAENRGYGNPGAHKNKGKRNEGPMRKRKHKTDWRGKEAETAVANTDVQSSFYKTLEGEVVQLTPLRTQPDYGEKTMDIKDMLEQLEQEENLTLTASAMAETLKTANARPAGGLYGYTKQTQRDVLASVRKVQKVANKIAKTIYAKDKNTFNFLHLHADRSNSLSARILCAAMENIGPKVAKTAGVKVPLEFAGGDLYWTPKSKKDKGYVDGGAEVSKWMRTTAYGKIFYLDGKLHDSKGNTLEAPPSLVRQLSLKKNFRLAAAGHGMYGYRVKTAKLALQACLDLSQEAGSVAYDLHTRRTAKYEKITSFLKDHSKRGRCRYARLLLRFYPDMPNLVTASDEDEKKADDEKEAKHEKGKKVPLKDMPKELQEQAKNPANHFKKKKAKLSPALEQMLSGMHEQNLKAITRWKATDKMTRDIIEGAKAELKRQKAQKSAADILIAQAEEILKDAGCENLPNEAMQEACEKKKEEAKDSDEKEDKTAGCEKLPNEAMQEACEAKKKDSDSKEAESDEEKESGLVSKVIGNPVQKAVKDGFNPKKASRTRLTTRIANGELQRGEVRYASDEDQDDEDQKDAAWEGRSALPGEEESNQAQPKVKGEMGYNPGSTAKNKAAAEDAELDAKAEGRTYLPGDEEADKLQPNMKEYGYEVGGTMKSKKAYETVTSVTELPDGAKLYWVE